MIEKSVNSKVREQQGPIDILFKNVLRITRLECQTS